MPAPTLYTLGHSNHSWPDFLELVRGNGIGLIADVRSRPRSRFPWFNQVALEAALLAEGIGYRWMGDRLGGRPTERALLDGDGNPDYAAMAVSPAFARGIADLLALLEHAAPVAMMCSEGRPEQCHREHLIAPALREAGVAVIHILPDGERLLV